MSAKHTESRRLVDKLAADNLPEQLAAAISQMQITTTVGEMIRWKYGEDRDWHIEIAREGIILEGEIHISTKRILTTLGAIASFSWLVFNLATRYGPDLLELLRIIGPGP